MKMVETVETVETLSLLVNCLKQVLCIILFFDYSRCLLGFYCVTCVERHSNDCSICGKHFIGYGNNPAPVTEGDDDTCCDACNANSVIPARIKLLFQSSDEYQILSSPKKRGLTKNQRKKENRRRRSNEQKDETIDGIMTGIGTLLNATVVKQSRNDWFFQENDSYFEFPTNAEFAEHLPLDGDDVYRCGWEIASMGYMWILCAYDPNTELAYGYVNMGDNECAEYGPIDIEHLRECFNKFKLTLKQLYPLTETFATGPVSRDDLKKGLLKGYLGNL